MDHFVARARDLPPGNLRILSPQIFGQVLDGLTDDFDSPQNRILDLLLFLELPQTHAGDVSLDEIDALEDVTQVDGGILAHSI